MKKLLMFGLMLVSLNSFGQSLNKNICSKNYEDNSKLLVGSLRYNNPEFTKSLFENKCIKELKINDVWLFEELNTVESLKLILEHNRSLTLNDIKLEFNRDLLSNLLLREIIKEKRKKINEQEEPEIRKLIEKVDVNNKLNYNWRPSDKDYKDYNDLLNFVAKSYYDRTNINKDIEGNIALTYAILANKPELLKYTYTVYNGKKTWNIKNNFGLFPLHYMFSPKLKGKNIEKLNDLVINEVPFSYILNMKLSFGYNKNYDYFQFSELLKENNPDFYKKLKMKYNFEINSLIKDKESISYINKSLDI